MRYYKMRAECMVDVGRFLSQLVVVDDVTIEHAYMGDHMMSDVECTFRSPNDLVALRTFLAAIPDGHVMLETLQLKENYTGERNI